MDDVITALKDKGIYSSIITTQANKNTYKKLYQETGGIFGDISSDFSEILENFANSILGISSKAKKAVYILPGYMGSNLYNDNDGKKLWEDKDELIGDVVAYIAPGGKESKLLRGSDGTGSHVHVDITKDKYGSNETYEKLVNKLQKEVGDKYDIVFFPYDWLGDLNDSAKKLEEHIKDNKYDKVVLVTHSTGGLLASNFIARSNKNRQKIEKAILIAPPLFGTYTALQPVETGNTADFESMLKDNGVTNSWSTR